MTATQNTADVISGHPMRPRTVTRIPPLAGLAEIAGLAGVSRSRASQIAAHPDFPAPVQRLAMGPVWREADVKAFLTVERKSGRKPRPSASDRRTRAAEAVCGCPCGHDDGGSCLTCAWVHATSRAWEGFRKHTDGYRGSAWPGIYDEARTLAGESADS